MQTDPLFPALMRLEDMRAAWGAAATGYFDPDIFRRNLQNCLMIGRTVTFVLQGQKSRLAGFDDWYEKYQSQWKQDEIMRWAVDARNTIEKRGDLATNSQVKLKIVASYVSGPETDWLNAPLFYPTIKLWMDIPPKILAIPQVHNHGTLVVERRWVADSLPNVELLQALSYVYKHLSIMLQDGSKLWSQQDHKFKFDHEPQEMRPLAMDRAEYVSVSTGEVFGHRVRQVPVSSDFRRKVVKRYEKIVDWTPLKLAKNLDDVASAFFSQAQRVMQKDGYHSQIAFLFKKGVPFPPIAWDHEDRAAKYLFVRDMADYANSIGADAVIFLGEAWLAKKEDVPASGFAAEAKERLECLSLTAADATGACFMKQAIFHRGKLNKRKIMGFGATETHTTKLQFMVAPFQLNWNVISLEDVDKFADDNHIE